MTSLLVLPTQNRTENHRITCYEFVRMTPALITLALCVAGLVKKVLCRNFTHAFFYGIGTTSSFYFLSLVLQFDLIASLRHEINRLQGITLQLEDNVSLFTEQNSKLTENVGQLEETRKGHQKLLEEQQATQTKLERELSEQRELHKQKEEQYDQLRNLARGQAANIKGLLDSATAQNQAQDHNNQMLSQTVSNLESVQESEVEIALSFQSIHDNFLILLSEHQEVIRITNAEFLAERRTTVKELRETEQELKKSVKELSVQIDLLNHQLALATQERELATTEKHKLTVDINMLRLDIANLRNELQSLTLKLKKHPGRQNAST